MKVMVLVKATKDYEAGIPMPDDEMQRMFAEMGNFNEALANAGVLLAAEGLQPSAKGFRIQFSGNDRMVVDGPFAETKEIIAGFWLWNVASMDEALAWAKQCPKPHGEDCHIEIRPLMDLDEFSDVFDEDMHAQRERILAHKVI